MAVSDQVVALDFGRKIAEGTPAEVQQQPGRDPGLSRRRPPDGGAAGGRGPRRRATAQTQALHGVDFALEAGGITTLLGANGAGKTTTLRAICGMVRTRRARSASTASAIDGRATEDDRAPRHRARAGRPRHLPRPHASRRTCTSAPTRGATAPASRADLERVYELFPAPRGAPHASRPARSRAASSRCWRSAAR